MKWRFNGNGIQEPNMMTTIQPVTLNEEHFCIEPACKNIRSDWSDKYCQLHQISHNIVYITRKRNPYFKEQGLLSYKLMKVLSKIHEEIEDEENWMQDYNNHLQTLNKFNDLLYKATGYRIDSSDLEGSDVFIHIDCLLIDYAYETDVEGVIDRAITLFTHADELIEYLRNY